MTYVEAKFGLTIRDSKPSDTVSRGQLDPMDVDAVNFLSSGKGKWSSGAHETVVSSAVEHIFTETAMHAKAAASNHLAKANRASHGPRLRAKERVKRARGNPKENTKLPKVPMIRTMVKTSKTGLSDEAV